MARLTADCTAGGRGEAAVVRVAGSLDDRSASTLHEALTQCLPQEPSLIVLDITALTEASPDTVGAFGALADQARAWPGANVVLAGPVPRVARTLLASGVTASVPAYSSVEAARHNPGWARGGPWPQRFRLVLTPSVTAATRARRLVDRACVEWALPGLQDPARLIVTELVSNAVRHAGTGLEVVLSRWSDTVCFGVRDESTAPPRPHGPVPPTVEGGRGLLVVDIMCRSWGITPLPGGKVVWASLATP